MTSSEWTVSGNFNWLCLFSHKWVKVKASATTVYWKCSRCMRREIIQFVDEYQPIDISFLKKDL